MIHKESRCNGRRVYLFQKKVNNDFAVGRNGTILSVENRGIASPCYTPGSWPPEVRPCYQCSPESWR